MVIFNIVATIVARIVYIIRHDIRIQQRTVIIDVRFIFTVVIIMGSAFIRLRDDILFLMGIISLMTFVCYTPLIIWNWILRTSNL